MPSPKESAHEGAVGRERAEDAEIDEAMRLLRGSPADRNRGVKRLNDALGRKLQRYFERHRVPEADAEQMVWDVWVKLLKDGFRGETRPVVWIWILARNLLRDFFRRQRPEVLLDDEGWESVLQALPAASLPEGLGDCIERATAQFELDHPERAQIMRMICEQWTGRAIGEVLGCSENAARDRVYRTRTILREYLEECREGV